MRIGIASLLVVVHLVSIDGKVHADASAPAAPASAHRPPEPESPDYKRAVDAALEEYRLGHFEEARSLFQRAHAIDQSARTLRGLGMVEFELRHYVKAAELLEASLNNQRKPLTPEQRQAVDDLLVRTRQFIARYALDVVPAGTAIAVELDGKKIDLHSDRRLSLEAGEHTLRISAPDTEPRELTIDVKGGEQQTLHIQLALKAAPDAPAPGPRVDAPASAQRRSVPPAAIGLLSAGAASVVAGSVVGVLALVRAEDAPTRDGNDADRAHSLAIGADVCLGVGIASAIVGGVLWWTHKDVHGDARQAYLELGAHRLKVRF